MLLAILTTLGTWTSTFPWFALAHWIKLCDSGEKNFVQIGVVHLGLQLALCYLVHSCILVTLGTLVCFTYWFALTNLLGLVLFERG